MDRETPGMHDVCTVPFRKKLQVSEKSRITKICALQLKLSPYFGEKKSVYFCFGQSVCIIENLEEKVFLIMRNKRR